jgi:hypothetical protein
MGFTRASRRHRRQRKNKKKEKKISQKRKMEIRNATPLIGERLRRNRIVHERFTKNPDANIHKNSPDICIE